MEVIVTSHLIVIQMKIDDTVEYARPRRITFGAARSVGGWRLRAQVVSRGGRKGSLLLLLLLLTL